MKLVIGESRPAPHPDESLLDPGDPVTISISHQLRINGDDSWVKVEATSKVRPGESADDTYNRVLQFVDGKAVQTGEHAAHTVMGTGH